MTLFNNHFEADYLSMRSTISPILYMRKQAERNKCLPFPVTTWLWGQGWRWDIGLLTPHPMSQLSALDQNILPNHLQSKKSGDQVFILYMRSPNAKKSYRCSMLRFEVSDVILGASNRCLHLLLTRIVMNTEFPIWSSFEQELLLWYMVKLLPHPPFVIFFLSKYTALTTFN